MDRAPAPLPHPAHPPAGCPRCGASTGPGAAFCASCGTRTAAGARSDASPRRSRHRPIASVALLACLVGLAALLLPLVQAVHGAYTVAPVDVPYLGPVLGVTFAALTVLPVLDVVRGRLRWTGWLCVPAVAGLVPIALALVALAELPRLLHLIWAGIPEWAVEVGPGPVVFAVADVALLATGALAVGAGVRARRSAQAVPGAGGNGTTRAGAAAGLAAGVSGRIAALATPENRRRAGRTIARGSAHALTTTATWGERAHERLRSGTTAGPAPEPAVAFLELADVDERPATDTGL